MLKAPKYITLLIIEQAEKRLFNFGLTVMFWKGFECQIIKPIHQLILVQNNYWQSQPKNLTYKNQV